MDLREAKTYMMKGRIMMNDIMVAKYRRKSEVREPRFYAEAPELSDDILGVGDTEEEAILHLAEELDYRMEDAIDGVHTVKVCLTRPDLMAAHISINDPSQCEEEWLDNFHEHASSYEADIDTSSVQLTPLELLELGHRLHDVVVQFYEEVGKMRIGSYYSCDGQLVSRHTVRFGGDPLKAEMIDREAVWDGPLPWESGDSEEEK